jgi:hypothetical protein
MSSIRCVACKSSRPMRPPRDSIRTSGSTSARIAALRGLPPMSAALPTCQWGSVSVPTSRTIPKSRAPHTTREIENPHETRTDHCAGSQNGAARPNRRGGSSKAPSRRWVSRLRCRRRGCPAPACGDSYERCRCRGGDDARGVGGVSPTPTKWRTSRRTSGQTSKGPIGQQPLALMAVRPGASLRAIPE